jgi:hypothetical protein
MILCDGCTTIYEHFHIKPTLPKIQSIQLAKLIALTQACHLYTQHRYIFEFVHYFDMVIVI